MLFVINFRHAHVAQAQVHMLNDSARKLSEAQMNDLWAKMPAGHKASISVEQALATIEVTTAGENTLAVFQMLQPVPEGSFIAYRMTLPNGTIVPLSGYMVPGGQWASYLWNGSFSGVWPSGWTLFEVIILNSKDGNVSYVSAYVPVFSCCVVPGPLQRVDVSQDGNTVEFTGPLGSDTIATLNGMQLMVSLGYSVTTGLGTGRISTGNFGDGQMHLTVCSGGTCSTREIYVTRTPQGK
jgi:hypothetical protein